MGTLRKMRRKSGRAIHKTKGLRKTKHRNTKHRKTRRHYGKSKRRKRRGGTKNPTARAAADADLLKTETKPPTKSSSRIKPAPQPHSHPPGGVQKGKPKGLETNPIPEMNLLDDDDDDASDDE